MTSSNVLENLGDLTEENLLEMARTAETAERYHDMCKFVSKLVDQKTGNQKDLALEERNLLSVAYKNVVGSKRASWRTLKANIFPDVDPELVEKYKSQVEQELRAICEEVLALLKDKLLPIVKGRNDETEVFYLKMIGDYYRYLAEFLPESDYKKDAEKYYSDALEVAKTALAETHPTRLGLALNFSVCYYEILKNPQKACDLAKQAFDSAIEKLDTLSDNSYKDSTLIMQLLRDNLTLWTSEQQEEES